MKQTGNHFFSASETSSIRWLSTTNFVVSLDSGTNNVRRVAKFVNDGKYAVKIFNERASCGCTQLQMSKKNIPPGDTCNVVIVLRKFPKQKKSNIYVEFQANTIEVNHKITISFN